MFIHHRSQGFILKEKDLREADRLFTIYTQDFGKLETLGRSIRKIKSKLRGGMQLFYLSEIEFIQGKTYKTLTDALLIESFPKIRKDLIKLNIAFKITETLDGLIKGEEKDEEIWCLLNEVFNKLNNYNLDSKTCDLFYYYFIWNILSILGYKPQLYKCSLCQKKLVPQRLFFNSKEGGIICQQCFKIKKLPFSSEINLNTIKILRVILKMDLNFLLKLEIKKVFEKELKDISEDYINNNFDFEYNKL